MSVQYIYPLYFPREGYHKSELYIEDSTLEGLKKFAADKEEGWEAIHEKHPNEKKGANDDKQYRFQCKMTSKEKRAGSLRTVLDECREKLKVIHQVFHITDTYLLKSLPGGPVQGWHRDYSEDFLKTLPNEFFVALSLWHYRIILLFGLRGVANVRLPLTKDR